MRSLRMHVVLMTAVVAAAALAQAQEAPAKPPPETNNDVLLNWTDVQKNIWARATPYVNDALPELEAAVPELKGLEPAPSQEQLSFILARVGSKCEGLLRRTPNVISREEVITQIGHARPLRQKFGYLMISRETPLGVLLHEYRTDTQGRGTTEETAAGPSSQGFASMWVRFYPSNQSESTFRYLGSQEMDKHKTFVVAFAQMPDLVKFPAEFLLLEERISVLYQGIAWIDSSDFRIVRMREDLLAPLPEIGLEKFSARVRFDEVNISKAASSLWLPREAIVEWKYKGRFVQQNHVYSHYRLYKVQTKIVPAE
jgi:hypothetical protein